jgi:hypothetical protein
VFVRRAAIAFCACAALVMSAAAIAQQIESTPIPEVPKPDFAAMNFLIGTWACSTKSARRPAPYLTTSTYTASPDGWWIEQKTVTQPVPWFNHTVTTYDKITYDPTTKRWIDVSYGDLGTYGFSTSPGWNGNAIVWHDPTFAPTSDITAQTDTTFTKDSGTKVTVSSSFTEASGRNVSVLTTCNKNP